MEKKTPHDFISQVNVGLYFSLAGGEESRAE